MKDKTKAITKAQAKLDKLEARESMMRVDHAAKEKTLKTEILKVKGQLYDLTRTEQA